MIAISSTSGVPGLVHSCTWIWWWTCHHQRYSEQQLTMLDLHQCSENRQWYAWVIEAPSYEHILNDADEVRRHLVNKNALFKKKQTNKQTNKQKQPVVSAWLFTTSNFKLNKALSTDSQRKCLSSDTSCCIQGVHTLNTDLLHSSKGVHGLCNSLGLLKLWDQYVKETLDEGVCRRSKGFHYPCHFRKKIFHLLTCQAFLLVSLGVLNRPWPNLPAKFWAK